MPERSSEQRFPLRDGQTAIVDRDDHVLILAADGGVTAESGCGAEGISYRRAVAFLRELIRLLEASDKHALVKHFSFPLHASLTVNTRAEFLAHYDQIFPKPEIAAISRADPGAVFCRNGAFMLGDGEIWAAPDGSGVYRVMTVNPPVQNTRRTRPRSELAR
jgi:hypothetical protein